MTPSAIQVCKETLILHTRVLGYGEPRIPAGYKAISADVLDVVGIARVSRSEPSSTVLIGLGVSRRCAMSSASFCFTRETLDTVLKVVPAVVLDRVSESLDSGAPSDEASDTFSKLAIRPYGLSPSGGHD